MNPIIGCWAFCGEYTQSHTQTHRPHPGSLSRSIRPLNSQVGHLSCEAPMLFFCLTHRDTHPHTHPHTHTHGHPCLPPASPSPCDSLSHLIYFNYPLYQCALLHFECLLSRVLSPILCKRKKTHKFLILQHPAVKTYFILYFMNS